MQLVLLEHYIDVGLAIGLPAVLGLAVVTTVPLDFDLGCREDLDGPPWGAVIERGLLGG